MTGNRNYVTGLGLKGVTQGCTEKEKEKELGDRK